jgi:hypothetical protein
MMPKFLADQLHGELNRAFHQDQLKNMLQIYQKVNIEVRLWKILTLAEN